MTAKNSFRNDIVRKYKAAKCISVFFAAMFMSFCMKSGAAAAGLPELYTDRQVYEETGRQIYGWREIDGQTYYFLPDSGQMAAGWMQIDGESYYFLPDSGRMALGWMQIDGESYYFLPDSGRMAAGWMQIDGESFYFLPDSGRMASGWIQIEAESYYFFPDSGRMASGWIQIEGESYYFFPDSGYMAWGWVQIDGESYYFFPDSGRMASGWMQIGEDSYYFMPDSGVMASGCRELKDGTYYFSPETGEMLTGWQETEIGRRYFSKANGQMAAGWQKIKGRKYYFSKDDGGPATGLADIDGEYYLFHPDGHLANAGKTSLVSVGNQIYCADKSGKPANGWLMIGKKLYYASKTGKAKKNTTYRGITFGRNGAAKNNKNTRLKINAMKVFASITKKNMSKSQKLAACWSYVTDGGFRYAAKYPNLNAAGWQRKTAYDMLSSHAGNCYGFACVFAALAEEAGCRPYVICGRVRGSRDRMADGYTRHAWVRINGRYYDPEAHYAGWRRGIYGSSSYPVSHTIQQIVAF